MSTADPISGRPPQEVADEYVLGLLDANERAAVEAAMESDTAMREAVAAARRRFHPLDDTADPVTPSAALWGRIAASLGEADGPGEDEARAPAPAPAAAKPEPAARTAPLRAASANDNAVRRWRFAALAAMAAALVMAAGTLFDMGQRPAPAVVAVLANAAGEPVAIIEDDGESRFQVTPLADIGVPESQSLQVWTLPADAEAPISLGLLPNAGTSVLDYGSDLPDPATGQLYEITIEPAGGSPTGGPTGEIVGKGFARTPR